MGNAKEMTPKGVIGLVIAAVVGVPVFIYLVIKIFTSGIGIDEDAPLMVPAAVEARLMPAGNVKVVMTAPVGSRTGQMVYESICITCHAEGLAGAPKFGDKNAWIPVLSKGFNTLVEHAIKGFNAMPARGGDPSLTDDEMKRAVAYMGNAAGGKFTEPPVDNASMMAEKIDPEVKGKEIYDSLCATCHAAGLNGAPKFGDKAAWTARLKVGLDNVIKISAKGKGMMPPKGGYMGSDEEFAAAVKYLVGHS